MKLPNINYFVGLSVFDCGDVNASIILFSENS